MSSSTYSLIAKISSDISGLEKGLNNGVSKVKKFATAITAAIATIGLGKLIASSITEGGQLEQSLGGVETLFKSSANTVIKNAKKAYATAGMSANSYMQNVTRFSASLLQSTAGDTKKAAKIADMAMIDMSDNANKMGTSMEDIQNAYQGFAKQNYTMLDNLRLGYGGTKSEMQRLLADATKLTGVKYDINNLSDVYNAIHAIQGKLDITGTTAKEASETLEGSFNAMKAAWENLKGNMALGNTIDSELQGLAQTASTFLFNNFLPMLGNVVKAIPDAVVKFIQTAKPIVKKNLEDIITNAFGADVTSKLTSFITPIKSSLSGLFSTLKGSFESVASSFSPIFDGIKNNFGALPGTISGVINTISGTIGQLSGLFSTIGGAISSVVTTISGAISQMDFSGFQNLAAAIIPAVTAAFQTFVSIVSPAISQVVKSFTGLWNAIQPILSALASALMPILQTVASFLGGVVAGALTKVSGIFDILKIAVQAVTPIVKFLIDVFKKIAPVLSMVAEWIGKAIGLFGQFGGAGNILQNMMKSAWNNIKSAIQAVANFIKGAINVLKTIFSSFGQAGNVLKGALTAAWNGIKAVIGTVKGFISSAINTIKSIFNSLQSSGSALKGGISSAWNGMKAVISSVAGAIKGVVNGVKNVFNNLRNINLRGAGQAIMNGFLGGLKSIWGKITSFVGSIAGWIKSHKGPISYDKRLLIPAGTAIMRGLDRGLMENFKTVQKNVSGMASDISNTMRSDLNLDNLKLSRSINTDVFMATELENLSRNPISSIVNANINLNLGNDSYRAFVEDITRAQNQKIDLELLYG